MGVKYDMHDKNEPSFSSITMLEERAFVIQN
jgi:hypothetical protein